MRAKTILSSIWLIFTFSLVSWWWIYAFAPMDPVDAAASASRNRMIMWEGMALLVSVLVGGGFLIFFSYKDQMRHQQLKLFFGNFSHDIKTSISRLRLQADLLSEDETHKDNSVLVSLLKDISSLDLQLENSLLMSHLHEFQLLEENIRLSKLFQSLSLDYPELKIDLQGDATLKADQRALRSVLKNILENSVRHGKATIVKVSVEDAGNAVITLRLQDNGEGSTIDFQTLGSKIVAQSTTQSNGIGLYLVRQLVHRMHGQIEFQSTMGQGFQTRLKLKGEKA